MVHEKERMEVHYETTTSDVQAHLGRVVQVDPIKPALKAPGIKRLNLKYEQLHSNFAFKFNLRRYTWANGSNAPTTSATPSTASSTRWRAPPRTAAPVRRNKFCPPSHSPRVRPSSLELNDILKHCERERDLSKPATSFSTLQILAS
jgi:hypothetical protein